MNSAATPPAPTNRSRSSQSSLRTSNSSSSSSSTTPSSSPSFIGRLDRTATDRRVSPTKQLVRSITQLVKRKTKTESLSNSGNSPPQASGVVLVNHSPTSSSTPALSLEKHSSSSSSLVANMVCKTLACGLQYFSLSDRRPPRASLTNTIPLTHRNRLLLTQ